MTSLIPKNPLPADGSLALLGQTNPLNLAAEAEHSQAVASLHAAAQTVFSAQAAQIAQLQATNVHLKTHLNDLTVTHKAELESQKALLTATTADLTAQIVELNRRNQKLYNLASKAPQMVSDKFKAFGCRGLDGVLVQCSLSLLGKINWKPYQESLNELSQI